MKRNCSFACGLLFVLILTHTLWSQGVGTSGDVRGTVTDPSGAVVPHAMVAAIDIAKGIRRTGTTDDNGRYRIASLWPAAYDVSVQATGFASEIQRGVSVAIGQTLTIDFRLRVSQVAAAVEVTDKPAVVDPQLASQTNTVPQQYITTLPIDRRDYLTFTLLMPGVSSSTVITDNTDFRVKQTPQSGLSFYGSNGRGNSITVDGGEANDDTGGVRLNVSQDAVQEFQINRSNYMTEMGAASGASVNIVTKSGTNILHGSAYDFVRNDAMDARNPFAFTPALVPGQPFSLTAQGRPIKNSLNRQQFGGSVGFPIKQDKTFLFAAFDGLYSNSQNSVPLLTDSSIFAPTSVQQVIVKGLAGLPGTPMVPCLAPPGKAIVNLPSDVCAFALQSILTVNPNPGRNPFVSPFQAASNAFIVNQFETNSGLFPFPIREYRGLARLDHQFSDRDAVFLRYNYAHLTESDPDLQALTAFSRGTSVLNWDSTLQGSWFHQFRANATNEARLQWNVYQFNVTTNDAGGPGLDVQGYGFFARNIFLPSFTKGRRYEFADNFALVRGHHNMKMGFYELVRGNNTSSQTFFGGRFEFLNLPGGLVSPCLQVPGACGLPASIASAPLSTLQSWSLGVPAFFEQGFGNPSYAFDRPFTAAYWQDQWQVRPNLTVNFGLRYELDSQAGPLNTYKKDFAPRVSFSWSPFGDSKTVIRGGYGIYYSPIYAQIPNVVKTLGDVGGTRQIANTLVSIRGTPQNPALNSAVIYQTLFAQGKILCGQPGAGQFACISPQDLSQFGLEVANTGPLPPGTVLFFGQPDYRPPQAQQASLGLARQIGKDLSISASYIYVHTTHLPWAIDHNLLPGAPVVTGTGADGLPTNGLPFQNWEAPKCQADPGLCFADATHTVLQNNQYSSTSGAVYNGGILEVNKRLSNHFTLLANYTYSKAIDDSTDFNSDYAPFNQVNLRAERALSDFDQRQKLVFAGVLEGPWQNRYLSDFQLSTIVRYNSGHPFNLLTGSDINGDNHFTNDRPPGAARNTGNGPNYATLDVRLSRTLRFAERCSLQFIADGFNVANRINYASVNNIVGATLGPPFNVRGTAVLSPSQPLAFTAAFPRREIQLGVRFDF